MPKHRHRLFTRWFNRRIDLGAILAGSLFILIWSLLPYDQDSPDPEDPARDIFVQPTTAPLSALPSYLRPELMLVPSRHSFRPSYDLPDLLSSIPRYPYTAQIRSSPAVEPEGMGKHADLFASMIRHYTPSVWMPSAIRRSTTSDQGLQNARLYVKISDELQSTRFRDESALLASLPSTNQNWHFSFWISFEDTAIESTVFIEEHSGDASIDTALLDFVRKPNVWENAAGSGTVWVWYVPETASGTQDEN